MTEIIERVIPLAEFSPHPRNYNHHPAEQIRRLRTSLRKFGQVRNIVVWRHYYVAGHGVAEAASAEGWPTLRANVLPDDWPEERVLAYLAADNELARLGDPDQAALAAILDDVFRFDEELLAAAGFSEEEFSRLLAEVDAGESSAVDGDGEEMSRAEELREKWQVEAGQLWTLGEHRLLCGDSRDGAAVARLMAGDLARCMWTDPPYGVNYVGKTGDALTIENDGADGLPELLAAAFEVADGVLEPGAAIYVAHPAGALAPVFHQTIEARGWRVRQSLVWLKQVFVLGHADYHYRHEPILYALKPGPGRWGRGGRGWYSDDSQDSVFEVDKPAASREHPTMKPVELVEAMLRNSAMRGQVVYEPFCGSGSTLIACERLGLRCRAVELAPGYAAATLERWSAATGATPRQITE